MDSRAATPDNALVKWTARRLVVQGLNIYKKLKLYPEQSRQPVQITHYAGTDLAFQLGEGRRGIKFDKKIFSCRGSRGPPRANF